MAIHTRSGSCVVERLGVKINLVEGEATNIKITQPVDILIAERILEEREILKF